MLAPTSSVNNPFVQTGETDVVIKVEGQSLYVHSKILSYQSSVFKELFSDSSCTINEVVLKDKKPKDVIVFLKFLYPEYQIHLTDQMNFKQLLRLSTEYEIPWLLKKIEQFLMSSQFYHGEILFWKYSLGLALASEFNLTRFQNYLEQQLVSYLDRYSYTEKTPFPYSQCLSFCEYYNLPNLQQRIDYRLSQHPEYIKEIQSASGLAGLGGVAGLVIAEKHDLVQLQKRLMTCNGKLSCSFAQLNAIQGFSTLSKSTSWHLVKRILSNHVSIQSINILDSLYKNYPNTPQVHHQSLGNEAATPMNGSLKNPFTDKTGTDVVMKVENMELHLHSAVLCHCSPVFKAMLEGNFKEAKTKQIELKDKKAKDVIEMLQFFFKIGEKNLNENTDFDELLGLCQEYQVDWLTENIENHLLALCTNVVDRMLLAEKYNLDKLRITLIEQFQDIKIYEEDKRFMQLSRETIYRLEKQHIMFSMKSAEPQFIRFLDTLFA